MDAQTPGTEEVEVNQSSNSQAVVPNTEESGSWPAAPEGVPVSDILPGGRSKDVLLKIASDQKLLLTAVLCGIVSLFLGTHATVVYFAAAIFEIVAVLRLSKDLHLRFLVLIFVACFVPLLSLLVLLRVNAVASKALTDAGIKVGLFGARLDDIRSLDIA